jgi:hypothetical protein
MEDLGLVLDEQAAQLRNGAKLLEEWRARKDWNLTPSFVVCSHRGKVTDK